MKLMNRTGGVRGQESKEQVRYLDQLGSDAVTGDVLGPGEVITDDTSLAGVLVKWGSILRIEAAAGTYIAFGDSAIGAVSATTSPGFKHPGGFILINATDNFIRSSAALTRLEVMVEGCVKRD